METTGVKYLWVDKFILQQTGKFVTITKDGKQYQLSEYGEDFQKLEYQETQLWVYDSKEQANNEKWDHVNGPYKLISVTDIKGGGRAPKRMENYNVDN